MKATEWRQSAILIGDDDGSATAGVILRARRSTGCLPEKFRRLVAIAVMALSMVVVTILMMAMVAMTMMISSLCMLGKDKAYLRCLVMARLLMTVLPALRLRRDHYSKATQCSQSDQSFLQHFNTPQ
jgi:hypothetical protein